MRRQKKGPGSEQAYLFELGNRLIWHFRPRQVQEILADYQEYFSIGKEHGEKEDAMIDRLGDTGTVVQELLGEHPLWKRYLHGWSGLFFFLFLFSVYGFIYFDHRGFLFFILGSGFLFALLHGKQRIQMEQRFMGKPGRCPLVLLLNLIVSLEVMMLENGMQYFVRHLELIPVRIGNIPIGAAINMGCVFSIALAAVFFIWLFRHTVFQSIWYFGWLVHVMGAILSMAKIRMVLRTMNLKEAGGFSKDILLSLSYYGIGLLLAACFFIYLRRTCRHESGD